MMSVLALVLGFALAQAPSAAPLPRVTVETELGQIVLEIDTVRAPNTAANFLKYVEAHLYDGGRFHRTVRTQPDNQPQNTVKIDVVQAGANPARTIEYFQPIVHEPTSETKLTHRDGVVSMARAQVNTARDQFFICIGDQRELDAGGKRNADGHGFAAFGRVVSGMDVVRKIQASPSSGQTLTPPVRILRVRRPP
jgi:peptidyl-prolyl cis-trans isomerase A (cyclophilin A)